MKYNNLTRAFAAVENRIAGLEAEEKEIKAMVDEQFGTAIPRAFNVTAQNFVIDPSNVGTGILDRMIKTDDTLSAAVQLKILMIVSKIGEYQHDDKNIKEFIQKSLNNMRRPNWGAAMEAMLSYQGYKFSVSEIIFKLDPELRKVPARIVTYHPSTLAFEVDENGEITDDGIIQFTNQHQRFQNPNWRFTAIRHGFKVNNPFSTPIDRLHPHRVPFFTQIGMVRIPRNKVIHLVGQNFNAFGNPYGSSAVRTCHLLWQLKVFILKQMGIATKGNATDKIWATAPMGEQKVEVTKGDGTKEIVSATEALRLMLSDIESRDSFITGPEDDGYKMTVISQNAPLDQYVTIINAINIWMFRAFLLPSLVLTDGQAGSRSLGDKHFQLVDKISDSEAEFFSEIIINEMIERIIIENFGIQENYGKFAKRPQNTQERQALAMMFGGLANDGFMKPHVKEDMAFVRESLNLPEDKDKSFFIDGGIDGEDGEIKPGESLEDAERRAEGAGGVDDHSDSAFNGAQVTALIEIVKEVANNEIPAESAILILIRAFQMDRQTAESIIKTAAAFVPADKNTDDPNKKDPPADPNDGA